ncbi:PAS domain-containing sensor histidine kinase [Methanolobus chelungpuianus]|uniref:PAS domain-containing sensor histidine kinase n=1 Tax=Methanolobus chelungpuianus TaxID=502115 RepID=UPI002114152A|nr:PAS domain-containing hybrid sensor histidine kinase/response regulator [Methanolobus chelungpuianus]
MIHKSADPHKKSSQKTRSNASLNSRVRQLSEELCLLSKELADTKEFYSERLENLNDVVFSIDNDGMFTYINSAIENITGYKVEEIIGTPYARYIHPEDLPGLMEDIRFTIAGERKPYMFRIIKKSGDITYVHTTSRPITHNGKITGINGLMVDIAMLKKVEMNLRKERDKAQKYLDVVAVSILATSREGKIFLINKKGCEILGYEERELTGKDFFETLLPEDIREEAKEEYRKLMEKEVTLKTSFESPVLTKSMETRTFEWNNMILEDENGKIQGLLTSGTDITDREKAIKALVMAKVVSDSAAQVKRDFITTMSHELRTPLNHVIGYSDILQKGDLGPLNEEQRKCTDIIVKSGERLMMIVNSIIEHSHIEEGSMKVEKKEFQLSSLIAAIEAFAMPLARKKKIELGFHLETGLRDIYSDENKLKTILYDLISNAIKFTPEKGSVSVRFTSADDITLTAIIEDTGIGISEEDRSKLFKPFSQVDSSLTRNFDGVGLGLYIVKEFVEMLEGSIEVESEPGKGSIFSFTIPVEKKQDKTGTSLVPPS